MEQIPKWINSYRNSPRFHSNPFTCGEREFRGTHISRCDTGVDALYQYIGSLLASLAFFHFTASSKTEFCTILPPNGIARIIEQNWSWIFIQAKKDYKKLSAILYQLLRQKSSDKCNKNVIFNKDGQRFPEKDGFHRL